MFLMARLTSVALRIAAVWAASHDDSSASSELLRLLKCSKATSRRAYSDVASSTDCSSKASRASRQKTHIDNR